MRRLSLGTLFLALAVSLVACGADSVPAPEPELPAPIVGSVLGAAGIVFEIDTGLAIVRRPDESFVAYVCDGKEGRAPTVSAWLSGKVHDDSFDVSAAESEWAPSIRLSGKLAGEAASGTVVLGDRSFAFDVSPTGGGGLAVEGELGDAPPWPRAWILLPDGEVRAPYGTWGVGCWCNPVAHAVFCPYYPNGWYTSCSFCCGY